VKHLPVAIVVTGLSLLWACGSASSDGPARAAQPADTTSTTTTAAPAATVASSSTTVPAGPVRLEARDVVTGLDTVWSLAWDPAGALWWTERGGTLTKQGGRAITIDGVSQQGESGLMGLEFDRDGRIYLMYTTASDNRIVRRERDGSGERVLVDGLRKAAIHDGGRIRFGPDGALYAGTGDASDTSLPQNDSSQNGKILRIDPQSGSTTNVAKGYRNSQGLCFARDGRFFTTEHGPSQGDEINLIRPGSNGGWPGETGNGIKNWTPTIAPAGCVVYEADLIPQWKGSLLFVTLKDQDLRRLTFASDGSVADEEILFDGRWGRLRDVAVGPDGAVYLATSNKDSRGSPKSGDDRIIRLAPAP